MVFPKEEGFWGERQGIAQKDVRAIAQKPQPEMVKMLQEPVFALPDCQPIGVNPLLYVVFVRDRQGTPKNLCDKHFAKLSGELSGAICLKTLVLLGSILELFRKFFGAVRAIFWLWGSFFGPCYLGLAESY